ncbi:MAG: polysaccharide deacetylase family protein, partial [Candidatus Heimdallarchaeota archaeon]|nr:polysaccharide deacetylase family protein [Candidatus Heimdallarchaeota archaeon]
MILKNFVLALAQRFLHPRLGPEPNKIEYEGIEITPFLFDTLSTLCISVDFELSWAFRYGKPIPELDRGIKTRENFHNFLNLFERYSVPLTWATVGHLFLESCIRDIKTGLAHPEMPRPKSFYENSYWKWKEGDWYHHDPCTDYKNDPNWYAPDLIDQILESRVEHEIGIHTFSHIDFSLENCDPNLAEAEIKKCIELMKERGLDPKSMVFPGNFQNYPEILRDAGIIAFRGVSRIDLSYPSEKCVGLWDIHQSYFLYPHRKTPLKTIKRYLNKALKKKYVFHLAFHPSDMNQETLEKVIEP